MSVKLAVENTGRWVCIKERQPVSKEIKRVRVKMNIDDLNNVKRIQVKGTAIVEDNRFVNLSPCQKVTHWFEEF